MENLLSILEQGSVKLKVEVSGDDLLNFSHELITRTKEEFLSARLSESKKEEYLTKEEVQAICGVCSATLWHWNRRKYLIPCKLGRRLMYRRSDIDKILSGSKEKAE